jgi:hypothetical protein
MAVNWPIQLQKCEHEQADGNQAYGDWSTHKCSLGFETKQKCNGESKKQLGELILNRHVPVMMIKGRRTEAGVCSVSGIGATPFRFSWGVC